MATPGTPEALTSGRIEVEPVIDGADHLVVVDLAETFGDQLVQLARAIADCGLMDEFAVIGRNRSSSVRVRDAVQALLSEQSIRDAGRVTISPTAADRLRDDVDAAATEPSWCRFPACGSYAIETGFCGHHLDGVDLLKVGA